MGDSPTVTWKVGYELELMSPPGRSRQDLARALMPPGGRVVRFFHPQSEPSKVPGKPVFENLTPGFDVRDADNRRVVWCVDDLTLQAGLERARPPKPGWYRVVSDDGRFLRLFARHADPNAPLAEAVQTFAALFGTQPEPGPGGMLRVVDAVGSPICIAAPLPGERERPCELVTAPIASDHARILTQYLSVSKRLGYTVPAEAALHIHFDAGPLMSALVLRSLVRFFHTWRLVFRDIFRTNPRCVRLGPWRESVLQVVEQPGFTALDWPEARARLRNARPTKYCDINLRNLAHALPAKNTLEVRILPVWLDAERIASATALLESALRHTLTSPHVPVMEPVEPSPAARQELFELLRLTSTLRHSWS